MINKIRIKNFKAFQDLTIDVRPLTLVVGENGIGKSSISQSILLLKQSISNSGDLENLSLNGDFVRIGNGVDALCQSADTDSISFDLSFSEGESLEVVSAYDPDSDVLACEASGGGLPHSKICL